MPPILPPPRASHTHELVAHRVLAGDVDAVLDTIAAGGIAIIPTCLTYAIVGHTSAAIARIFAAKQRSYDKPCGMFGSAAMCCALHILPAQQHEIVRALAEEEGLPFSVVAPFREDDPFFRRLEAGVIPHCSRRGTMDMVVNGGPFLAALAARSRERGIAVFGSSANLSLQGSKYRLKDIEPEIFAAADLALDYGISRYAHPDGLSSTIIDFRDFTVVRRGHCYVALQDVLRNRFGVML